MLFNELDNFLSLALKIFLFRDRHEDVLHLWPGHDQLCAGEHSIGKENIFNSGKLSTSGANNDRHIGKFQILAKNLTLPRYSKKLLILPLFEFE